MQVSVMNFELFHLDIFKYDSFKLSIFFTLTTLQPEAARVVISPSVPTTYSYSVKIVNPQQKSDYTVKRLPFRTRFCSVEELRQELKQCLGVSPSQIGYIEPGHGLKGKQRWLANTDDIEEMYSCFERSFFDAFQREANNNVKDR